MHFPYVTASRIFRGFGFYAKFPPRAEVSFARISFALTPYGVQLQAFKKTAKSDFQHFQPKTEIPSLHPINQHPHPIFLDTPSEIYLAELLFAGDFPRSTHLHLSFPPFLNHQKSTFFGANFQTRLSPLFFTGPKSILRACILIKIDFYTGFYA